MFSQVSEYACLKFQRILNFSASKCQGLKYDKIVNMGGLHRLLIMPEKPEYVLKNTSIYVTMLNMLEHAWVKRLNKSLNTGINKVLNMPEFWLSLIQCKAEYPLTNYLAIFEAEVYSDHCQAFKRKSFVKWIMLACRHALEFFQDWGSFVELGTLINVSSKTQEKKDSQGNFF